jgi:hypothetical protein
MPELNAEQRAHMATVQAQLDAVNPLIFGAGSRMSLRYVRWQDVREQDINANVMPVGMFNALVANIRKNSALESLPLCATRIETPNKIEVVSGHHRVRAANAAGIEYGVTLLYTGLTDSEIKAKQLAHNSISGQSDPDIVREIFSRIVDVDAKVESYIDPDTLQAPTEPVHFEEIDVDPLADAKTVTLVFLPTQARDFQTAMDVFKTEPDTVYVGARDAFEGFRAAVNRVRTDLEILAYPTAITEMARLAMERMDQLTAEREARAAAAVPETEGPLARARRAEEALQSQAAGVL